MKDTAFPGYFILRFYSGASHVMQLDFKGDWAKGNGSLEFLLDNTKVPTAQDIISLLDRYDALSGSSLEWYRDLNRKQWAERDRRNKMLLTEEDRANDTTKGSYGLTIEEFIEEAREKLDLRERW